MTKRKEILEMKRSRAMRDTIAAETGTTPGITAAELRAWDPEKDPEYRRLPCRVVVRRSRRYNRRIQRERRV